MSSSTTFVHFVAPIWNGGSNLKLVSHVFGIYLANKLKYVSMFEALLSSFQNDVEKTLVMQEGCAKASEILEIYRQRRTQAGRLSTPLPSLLDILKECRKAKSDKLEWEADGDGDIVIDAAFREGDGESQDDYPSGPMLLETPAKKQIRSRKIGIANEGRMEYIEFLKRPLFSVEEAEVEEKKEAEALLLSRHKEQTEDSSRNFKLVSIQKENAELHSLFELMFRALVCQNDKSPHLYKRNDGVGDIDWDINIRDNKTDNSVLETLDVELVSEATHGSHVSELTPRGIVDIFVKEQAKYVWFVGMYKAQSLVPESVKKFEVSLGQVVQRRLKESKDPKEQIFVQMCGLDPEVKGKKLSTFAFYRARFEESGVQGDGATGIKPPTVRFVNQGKSKENLKEVENVVDSLVLKLGPISKHPNGEPQEEVHEELKQKLLKTVWKLKEKAEAKMKTKKEEGSEDEESEAEVTDAKKRKGSKRKTEEDTMKTVVKMLKEQEGRFKRMYGKNGKAPTDDKEDDKRKGICFGFKEKGRCTFGDRCRFSHAERDKKDARRQGVPGRQGRAPEEEKGKGRLPDPPSEACEKLKKTGKCEDDQCGARHGKWNKTTDRTCNYEKEGKCCKFLFTSDGCTFLHEKIKNV